MSATTISPHKARPGINRCPGFLRKKVTVSAAVTYTPPSGCPVSPDTPLGTSIATTGNPFRLSTICAAAPSSGRESPAPNSASTTSLAPSRASGVSASRAPFQRSDMAAASLLGSASWATRTMKPYSSSSRATTKPSPPLLPGPHSTVTVEGLKRAAIASATARPAFSIRVSDGTPCATAKASALLICAVVRISPVIGWRSICPAAPATVRSAPAACRRRSARRYRACRS